METLTISNKFTNMYKVDDFQELGNLNIADLNNKLFCTFTTLGELDELLKKITSNYAIMYNKIFVLHIKSNDEYVCTYNIEQGNTSGLPLNTIMVHRKKDTNTLYTINALNECIKNLNNGVLDSKFMIPWENFKNMLLITNSDGLNKINTRIYKIEKI